MAYEPQVASIPACSAARQAREKGPACCGSSPIALARTSARILNTGGSKTALL